MKGKIKRELRQPSGPLCLLRSQNSESFMISSISKTTGSRA